MKFSTALALIVAAVRADDDDEVIEPTSVDVESSSGYTMTLEYWVAKLPDDEFSPLYLYFSTTLSTFTMVFSEGLLIGQWYKFY